MRRGDLVTIALQGDYGKPRPALVIQSDQFSTTTSVTLLLMSGTLVNAPLLRVTIQPTDANGLLKASQVVVDKTMTVRRDKVGKTFGCIEPDVLVEVERCLAVFLGIAK